MNGLLQILGSIASIGGIPLAIYLFLRSIEAKHQKLRRDIVKILSYQIGEGRSLSTFDIQSVILSKARESGGKANSIGVHEIVEDLVSETISSPMLNSERKDEILKNLRVVHRKGSILASIDRYDINHSEFLTCVTNLTGLTPEDQALIASKDKELEVSIKKPKPHEKSSEIFAIVGAVATLVAFILSFTSSDSKIMEEFSKFFKNNDQLVKLFLGIGASLIASVITAILSIARKDDKKKRIHKKQDDSANQ